jgi:hypothetical protein
MSDDSPTQSLGAQGEPCPACGAPLAADQRYCLNCGRRRAGARVPYADLLAGRAPEEVLAPAASPPPPPPPSRRSVPLGLAAAGAAGIAAVLLLGVLIGAATGGSDQPTRLVASPTKQQPPVINVNAGGTSTDASSDQQLTSDWSGEDGWTVQLQTLSKDSSQVSDVDQAKSDAESKGAKDVGALDSDEYPSLDPGQYVVYSGTYTGKDAKKKAQAAAKKLKKDFPDAKAVKVSAGDVPGAEGTRPEEKVKEVDRSQLEDLQNSTGEEQQKKSAKLPDTVGLGGKPPAKDNGKAGAGTPSQEIK